MSRKTASTKNARREGMIHASRIATRVPDHHSHIRKYRRHCACLMLLAFVSMLCDMIEAGDPLRYRAGLRLSAEKNKLSEKERRIVIDSLREKSGFEEIGFDENGFLSLGDVVKFAGGSSIARELLMAAMNLPYAIDLESHNRSKEIAFARLDKPVHFMNISSGEKINVYPIQIDFIDFNKLRGDKEVVDSFDIGFTILHELGHAVLGLHDSIDSDSDLGECERHINSIRRELGYPVREHYLAKTYSRSLMMTESSSLVAELNFTKLVEGGGRSKKQRYALTWSAHEVGPIVSESGLQAARGRSSKSIAASIN